MIQRVSILCLTLSLAAASPAAAQGRFAWIGAPQLSISDTLTFSRLSRVTQSAALADSLAGVVVTGGLTQMGSAESFARLSTALAPAWRRLNLLPSAADLTGVGQSAFATTYGASGFVLSLGRWRVIGIPSSVPAVLPAEARITRETFHWLDSVLVSVPQSDRIALVTTDPVSAISNARTLLQRFGNRDLRVLLTTSSTGYGIGTEFGLPAVTVRNLADSGETTGWSLLRWSADSLRVEERAADGRLQSGRLSVALPQHAALLPAAPVPRAKSPRERWRVNVGATITAPPSFTSRLLVVTTASGDLIGFSPLNGAVRWQADLSGPAYGGALATTRRVYAVGADGMVYAFATATGDSIWAVASTVPSSARPEMKGDSVAIQGIDGNVRLYEAATGKLLATRAKADPAALFLSRCRGSRDGMITCRSRGTLIGWSERFADGPLLPPIETTLGLFVVTIDGEVMRLNS